MKLEEAGQREIGCGKGWAERTGSFLRRSYISGSNLPSRSFGHVGMYQPTFDVASVSELRVLDLPALGLPTRPIRGSRGMMDDF